MKRQALCLKSSDNFVKGECYVVTQETTGAYVIHSNYNSPFNIRLRFFNRNYLNNYFKLL